MKQSRRFKPFAAGIIFALALSLGACSGDEPNVQPPASEAPSTEPSIEPSIEPSGEPSAPPADEPSGGLDTPGSDTGNGGEVPSEGAVTIGELVELAKKGKVPGCEYAAHTALFDEIEKAWGKPDTNETAGKGIYAAYEKKGITFGYNKGMIVFDIRAYADELHSITLKDIEAALGKADKETVNGSDDIYAYEINEQFQLKFVIPESTGKVDHISVFSESDTKNNMAG
ncbi:DUF4309 domain-containing protein [Paenibacillus arenilitoris]|uniref:DUF4309 domain-containing protein n=1 Tax=Paenibacillus arenilitoris TaxID=2772299 RepID=A0A927CP41_9BACL|nr:DUF4309 domain-containing protein [Paenibacillus arenilitoris]MBD2870472.1 DUF4309 domain-containing protein [Paenibacillus arenilitoris]